MHVYTNVYIIYIYIYVNTYVCVVCLHPGAPDGHPTGTGREPRCGAAAPRTRGSGGGRVLGPYSRHCEGFIRVVKGSCKVLRAFFSKVYVGFSGFVGFRILWVYAVVLWRFLVSGSRAHCLSVCLSSYISIYQLPTYLPIYLFYLSICIYPSCVQSCMFAALRILRFGKSRDQSFVV